MRACFITLITISILFCAIGAESQVPVKPVVPPDSILKNMNNLLNYNSDHLRFSENFIAYDTHMKVIGKGQFLQQLTTGNYLPLQLYSKNNAWEYQLYKLNANTDDDLKRLLKQIGNTDYGFYQMVGRPFPEFHYVDLNGKVYTTQNTKGKIVVLKAWFTACIPCVAEMPELNKLTEKYKNRKDIVFISIAWNPKKALENFTKHTTFKYAVVPVKAAYIEQTLHATGYPAHWIINKDGIVVNMTYDKDEMIAALRKEVSK
jgi:peroxiredoxin